MRWARGLGSVTARPNDAIVLGLLSSPPRGFDVDSRTLELTDDSFDTHVASRGGVVLVCFYAPWCTPCRRLAPVLEQLAERLARRATIAKIDVDAHGDVVHRFGIENVPTLVVFVDGRIVEQHVGALPLERLQGVLERHLS